MVLSLAFSVYFDTHVSPDLITSSSEMKTSVFSQVRSTSENLNFFITRDDNFYGIH